MRELAKVVGVTHAAMYRHFVDKDALLDALSQRGFELLAGMQKTYQAQADPDPLEQLNALLFAYLDFARDQPGYYAVMFRSRAVAGEGGPEHQIHNAEPLQTLHDAIRACQEAGLIIPGDIGLIAAYTTLAPHGLACFGMQGDRTKFLGLPADADIPAQWLADLILQPLLVRPKAVPDMVQLFDGTSGKPRSDM
ncbi:TetR/AcrR family transcriptional regulator [Pararhodobacter marinus]|uniref:TetR/AcrR family transcriptional regulator n=1 Tax=Pararhodobacter marinus TaxID=2184063 RepID=UPI003516EE27